MDLKTALQLVIIITCPILAVLTARAYPSRYKGVRWVRIIVIIGLSVFVGLPLFFALLLFTIKLLTAR